MNIGLLATMLVLCGSWCDICSMFWYIIEEIWLNDSAYLDPPHSGKVLGEAAPFKAHMHKVVICEGPQPCSQKWMVFATLKLSPLKNLFGLRVSHTFG